MQISRKTLLASSTFAVVGASALRFAAPADAAPEFRLHSQAATVAMFGVQKPTYWGM